jgi:hypothetical protein
MANRKVTAAELTTEAMVAEAGVLWLRLNGWMVHRLTADRWSGGGNRKKHERDESGTPDYICTLQGQFWCGVKLVFYWECKRTKGGILRDSQKEWALRHPKELVCFARSLEQLQAWVKERTL